jgi:hypothetical protein
MELEPIERLYGLLRERVKVADKITGIQSALDHVKTALSTSLAQQWMDRVGADIHIREDLMKEEQTYERLLQALQDMKAQLEERVRPVAEQIVQAEVERLRDISEQHRSALMDCVTRIDQSILNCRAHMTEYQQRRSDLAAVNQRLAGLGAEPAVIPDEFSTPNLGDIIRARVAGLHLEGKI